MEKMKNLIIDCICFLLATVLVIVVHQNLIEPYKQGYFCDDASIRYPPKDDTVTEVALILIVLLIGFLSILFSELTNRWGEKGLFDSDDTCIFGLRIPSWLMSVFESAVVFLFGTVLCELTVNVVKVMLGRKRPNFYYTCLPDFDCGSVPTAPNQYIVDYNCTNVERNEVIDSRKSFPSGHSADIFYAAVFSSLYIYKRMKKNIGTFLKSILVTCLFTVAAFVALSRITDNKHHWSDVLVGSLWGSAIALGMICLIDSRIKETDDPETSFKGVFTTEHK